MKIRFISTSSPIQKIEDLRFFAIPKDRVINVTKIARHGNVTLYLADDQRIFSSSVTHSGHYCFGRGFFDDFLRAAAKLGVVTNKEVQEHLKAATLHDKGRVAREKVVRLKDLAHKLGIILTKKQLIQLDKILS